MASTFERLVAAQFCSASVLAWLSYMELARLINFYLLPFTPVFHYALVPQIAIAALRNAYTSLYGRNHEVHPAMITSNALQVVMTNPDWKIRGLTPVMLCWVAIAITWVELWFLSTIR